MIAARLILPAPWWKGLPILENYIKTYRTRSFMVPTAETFLYSTRFTSFSRPHGHFPQAIKHTVAADTSTHTSRLLTEACITAGTTSPTKGEESGMNREHARRASCHAHMAIVLLVLKHLRRKSVPVTRVKACQAERTRSRHCDKGDDKTRDHLLNPRSSAILRNTESMTVTNATAVKTPMTNSLGISA